VINAEELIIRHSTVDNCCIDTLQVEVLTLDDMIRKPEEERPLPAPERLPGHPRKPGRYWWWGDRESQGIMRLVRSIDGQLFMQLFYQDNVLLADSKGCWRGPLRPSHGPLNQ